MQVRNSIRRKVGALALGITVVAGGLALAAPPAGAASGGPDALAIVPTSGTGGRTFLGGIGVAPAALGPHSQAFTGHFSGDTGGDLFLYNPGSGSDRIFHLGSGGTTSGTAVSVGGTYLPIVGDYDGNGVDDILWYAPGTAADSLWRFNNDGTHVTVAVNISGTYRPTVLDANGDGRDDILWYGPGSAGDSLWLFGSGATSHAIKSLSIGGNYQVVAGEFGLPAKDQPADRVVFYNSSGTDYFWTFDTSANHTSATLPALDGTYQIFEGQWFEETYGSILFYAPGAQKEVVWGFGPGPGGDVAVEDEIQIAGTYTVQVGDYDGNGLTDLALTTGSATRILEHQFDGTWVTVNISDNPTPSIPRTIDMR